MRIATILASTTLCAVLSTGCGSSPGATTADPSTTPVTSADSLDGTALPAPFAAVTTPRGVALVTGSRNGHPAILVPTADGHAVWTTASDAPAFPYDSGAGIWSWADGDVVHLVGRDCPETPTTTDDIGPECVTSHLSALTFSTSDGRWTGTAKSIDVRGTDVAPLAGNGHELLAVASEGESKAGRIVLIDVSSGAVTTVGSEASTGPITPVCPVDDGFVVSKGEATTSQDPDTGAVSGTGGPDVEAAPLPLFFVDHDGVTRLEVTGPGHAHTEITSMTGCSGGRVLAETGDSDTGASTLLLTLDDATSTLTAVELAAPDLGTASADNGSAVGITTDLTGTTILARPGHVAAGVDDELSTLAIRDPDSSTWRTIDTRVPTGSGVTVDRDGTVLGVTPAKDNRSATIRVIASGS